MEDIQFYLKGKAQIVDGELDRYLQKTNAFLSVPDTILEAMRYAVFAGGKRLRPVLAISSCEALGGKQEEILPAACALELIHTYSLVHDDLPSMDDDNFRRGKPTTHKVFGEALAILTGDALLTLAFEIMSKYPEGDESTRNRLDRKKLDIIQAISSACGMAGMIGGQVRDLQAEGKKIKLHDFEILHLMKTSALIEASLIAGAIMADASIQHKRVIANFGRKIGFAYQITDDLLDVHGKKEFVGKETQKDYKKEKATFPSFHGIDNSVAIAKKSIEEAKILIQPLGESGKILTSMAEFIITRTR